MSPTDPSHPISARASASEGAMASAAASNEIIALPERPPAGPHADGAAEEEGTLLRLRGADWALVVFAVLLGMLLASFTARNSDIWLHLAVGRDLTTGATSMGVQPFTYTGADTYWVNNSWLYDLLSYALYTLAGGWSLVAVKSLLLGATVWVMLRVSRLYVPRHHFTIIPALCVFLAVLAMAPWLPLRPVVISYLFLALTLLFLEQGTRRVRALAPAAGTSPLRALLERAVRGWWPLLVLFACWVNLDGWFLLGPLTAVLYAVGRIFDARLGASARPSGAGSGPVAVAVPEPGRLLGAVAVLGVLACLLNPHVFMAFRLPAALGLPGNSALLEQDPYWWYQSASPLSVSYRWWGGRLNAAALAFYVLGLVGLMSFLRERSGLLGWRGLVWVGFAMLAVYRAHLVPFFAVVAAPITAINLQEILLARFGAQPRLRGLPRSGAIAFRVMSLAGAMALLVMAWPGWLQPGTAGGDTPRRWELLPDPTLRDAALQLGRWRRDGVTAGMNGLHSSLELADYCAWFAPQEKALLNDAVHGSTETLADFVALRHELVTRLVDDKKHRVHPEDHAGLATVQSLLSKHDIGYLALDVSQEQNSDRAFAALLSNESEWTVVSFVGRVAIFARNDPQTYFLVMSPSVVGLLGQGPLAALPALAEETPRPCLPSGPLAKIRIDMEQMAYHPTADQKAPAQAPKEAYPPAPDWRGPFLRGDRAPTVQGQLAQMYLMYFETRQLPILLNREVDWPFSQVAGLVGEVAPPAGVLDGWSAPTVRLTLEQEIKKLFGATQNDGPVAPLLLAVRAARQAIADDPHDALSYATLGEVYFRLLSATKERSWRNDVPQFGTLRIRQMIAAYKAAVRLNPHLSLPHFRLAKTYEELGATDLALEHYKALHKNLLRGPTSNLIAAGLNVFELETFVKLLQKEVSDLQSKFAQESEKEMSPLGRAMRARELGLVDEALRGLKIIKYPRDLGRDSIVLELSLLLEAGRAAEAATLIETRDRFDPDPDVEDRRLEEIRAHVAAALGSYREADQILAHLLNPHLEMVLPPQATRPVPLQLGPGLALRLGQSLLDAVSPQPLRFAQAFEQLQDNATVNALRGALALEAGEMALAEDQFRRALSLSGEGPEGASTVHFRGHLLAADSLAEINPSKK